jgi:hypothetical protein
MANYPRWEECVFDFTVPCPAIFNGPYKGGANYPGLDELEASEHDVSDKHNSSSTIYAGPKSKRTTSRLRGSTSSEAVPRPLSARTGSKRQAVTFRRIDAQLELALAPFPNDLSQLLLYIPGPNQPVVSLDFEVKPVCW